jgi:hypothetical protein
LRLLAAAAGIALVCIPFGAGARDAVVPVLSAQVISLLMLDTQLTVHTPKTPKAQPPKPAATGPLDPIRPKIIASSFVLLPPQTHMHEQAQLAIPFPEDAAEPDNGNWRDYVGPVEIPAEPPMPGSYTDRVVVLQLSDLGHGPVLQLRDGLAAIPLRALGWQPTGDR